MQLDSKNWDSIRSLKNRGECRLFFDQQKSNQNTRSSSFADVGCDSTKKNIDMQNQNRYIHEFIHLIAPNSHHVPCHAINVGERAAPKSIYKSCACARDSYQLNTHLIPDRFYCLIYVWWTCAQFLKWKCKWYAYAKYHCN